MNAKFCGMLGLAMRAGKLSLGEGKAADAVRGGKCELLILATDAGPNTEKRFLNMTEFYDVSVLRPCGREELSGVLGKPAVVLAVTDQGFASQLKTLLEQR